MTEASVPSEPLPRSLVCSNGDCSLPAVSMCARCRNAWYCNVQCQRAHWKGGHKAECKPISSNSPGQNVSSLPPVPSSSDTNGCNIFTIIRESTAAAFAAQHRVRINEKAIEDFVTNLDQKAFKRATMRVPYPLQFDTNGAEINFHSIMALLRFGGHYSQELSKRGRMNALEVIRYGLVGAHLSRTRLDATFMSNIGVGDVASTFNIPVREEAAAFEGVAGITVERPGPLQAYAQDIADVLNAVGKRLLSLGYNDMAQLILDSTKGSGGAAGLVNALTGAIGQFDDRCIVLLPNSDFLEARQHKNAQILARELHARVSKSIPALKFTDINELTGAIDANTISGLLAAGILEPVQENSEKVSEPWCEDDTSVLRVAASIACDKIKELMNTTYVNSDAYVCVSALDVSMYAAALAEAPDVKIFVPEISRDI